MKILLINTLYSPYLLGGTERVVQSLAEGLVKAGNHVVVATTVPEKGTASDWINGVKVYHIGLRNLYWPFKDEDNHKVLKPLAHALDTCNLWMAREVERVLDTERPDVVHTHGLGGFSVLTWRRIKQRRLPLIHTLHDHYLLCPRTTMYRNGKACKRQCAACLPYALPRKHLSRHVDLVVGVSQFMLARHLEFGYFGATQEKRVVPNAYHLEPPEPPPRARSLPIQFGYLGLLHPNKGLETLLESATRLPKGTWSLKIAGRGHTKYERYLHEKFESPAIRFVGRVEPETFLSEVDVLVVPSLWNESFGMVVIEAYAHGVPVIGSDRGGISELVEAGVTGYLFDPARPGDLITKMERYVDRPDLVDDMRPACLRRARSFSSQQMIEQYLDAYATP